MKKSNKNLNREYFKNNIEERIRVISNRMLKILSKEFESFFEEDEKCYQASCQTVLTTLIPIWLIKCFPNNPKQVKKMMFEGIIKNQENIFCELLNIDSTKTVN